MNSGQDELRDGVRLNVWKGWASGSRVWRMFGSWIWGWMMIVPMGDG